MTKMQILSKQTIATSLTSNIKNILQNLKRQVDVAVLPYSNSKAYTDIILKGFEIMLIDHDDLNILRTNMIRISNDILNSNNIEEIVTTKQDIKSEIDDIIKKLEDFATKYKLTIEDTITIVNNKVIYDNENKLIHGTNNLLENSNEVITNNANGEKVLEDSNYLNNSVEFTTNNIMAVPETDFFYTTSDNIPNYYTTTYQGNAATDNYNCISKLCTCERNISISSQCRDLCSHVCSQKYQLQRWSCDSVNNSNFIPLHLICNGFLDCIDESDETECNFQSGMVIL